MYSAVTRNIRVTVEPKFLADRSQPAQHRYFWSYTVEIANAGDDPVQLTHRHWKITDGNGRLEEVRGQGVVGEQHAQVGVRDGDIPLTGAQVLVPQ